MSLRRFGWLKRGAPPVIIEGELIDEFDRVFSVRIDGKDVLLAKSLIYDGKVNTDTQAFTCCIPIWLAKKHGYPYRHQGEAPAHQSTTWCAICGDPYQTDGGEGDCPKCEPKGEDGS